MSGRNKASMPVRSKDRPGVFFWAPPVVLDAALVLADGEVFWGRGAGTPGISIGEICFNTSMTGYQEILTDPSYAGQLITFTFPHIGNVGANFEDMEAKAPGARGVILREDITKPASWRAAKHLDDWLRSMWLIGITGVDTRRLSRRIRDGGVANGALVYSPGRELDIDAARKEAAAWPGLEGMDLAKEVTCSQTYQWDETEWAIGTGFSKFKDALFHVIVVDFGVKHNILRCLASAGCKITVVPATTPASEILAHSPDGVFLSNGPGDPAATGDYAIPMVQTIIETGKPIFGICLGHQILALALGAKSKKMHMGHRGANHPVKDLATGKVEITSQNHGFVIDTETLPSSVTASHISLFDGTLEGLRVKGRPIFSVQYHPEGSPGPHDSRYLFRRFVEMMENQ